MFWFLNRVPSKRSNTHIPQEATLISTIQSYQTGLERIFYAGIDSALFTGSASLSGGATGGRTFISGVISERIRQDGYIRQVKARAHILGTAGKKWKFKVFRPSGSSYDYVGESEVVEPLVVGTTTFTLTTPIACQPGDILGVWLDNGSCDISCKTIVGTASIRYTSGDIIATNAFATTVNNFALCLEGLGTKPFLTVTGDSIAEGHDGSDTGWHSFYHLGPAGNDITYEIMYNLRGLLGIGDILEYQNHAMGSQTFAWVASTGIVSTVITTAKAIIIHCGINDISSGRTWAQVEANLDTIKAALAEGQHLFIDEILPWTAGTDEQAATIRTFNSSLATWCAANSATLIACHNTMGQLRASTGYLDDLLAAYDQDGVHLTPAGAAAMAAIWETALINYYG